MSFLTSIDFISCPYDFILWNIKEDILDPVNIHSLDNFFKNIYFSLEHDVV